MITLVLGDRRQLPRNLVATLSEPVDFVFVGQAADGYELIKLVEKYKPDIALLDQNLPFFDCFQAVSVLTSRSPATRTIILTDVDHHKRTMEEIFDRHIAGYISRDSNQDLLLSAIRTVHHGAWLISPQLAQINETLSGEAITALVSPTELEIIGRVGQGYSTREIAAQLCLSEGTVRNYTSSILQKIGLKDRTQIAIFAVQHGLGGFPQSQMSA